jgi:hypothetical protein
MGSPKGQQNSTGGPQCKWFPKTNRTKAGEEEEGIVQGGIGAGSGQGQDGPKTNGADRK